MQYEKINPIRRQQVEVIFNQGSSEEIAAALLSVTFHEEEWLWVQSSCLKFLASPDENLRAVAVTCLGHLARLHGMVDAATVVPALQAHLSDPALAGRVSDALEDIELFSKGTPT